MVRVKHIPQALGTLRRWVLWKYVIRGQKPEKLPFRAFNAMASVSDETTWTTLESASENLDGFDGLGFVFDEQDGLCGIDFDGCRDAETGKVEQWAREWIVKLNSYSEVSPSGTGMKVVVQAKSPFPAGRKIEVIADAVAGDKKPGIEVYDRRRYFCITGQKLSGLPADVELRQDVVDELCKHFFPVREAKPVAQLDNGSIYLIWTKANFQRP